MTTETPPVPKKVESAEAFSRDRAILQGINRIFREALTCETEEELGIVCLRVAEELTQSRFGFIGLLGEEGLLDTIAISDPGWVRCRMEAPAGSRKVPTGLKVRGIYGRVLLDGRSFFTNDPPSHPDSIGLPEGHPAIKAFLGAPLIFGGKTVGMVALGNRDGGYGEEERETLEALATAMVQALMHKKEQKARLESEQMLAAELDAAKRLQQISMQLQINGIQTLYEQILDAAMAILHADFASLQLFDPERGEAGELKLLGYRGFSTQAARFWEWVSPSCQSVCGRALQTRQRVFVPDVKTCEFMSGSKSLETCLDIGIRAVQTTPLFSRTGILLGMISTHWREPHQPQASELRALDVLARQTADLIEGKQGEEALKEAKTAAEEASRAKSEFLANMSHEIRTPMTVFMAAIEHLRQIDRDPERRRLLRMAEKSAQRLRSLIDDILDFSRIEAGKVEIEEEPFDLRHCIGEAVDMFVLPAREKKLRIETEVAAEVPERVTGDAARLGQVLVNLIGNAVKFTEEGEIRLCVQRRDDLLEFSVADTGIGIPEEKRHQLFQSFSQADATFSRRYGGTGLGLAICKGLVELMGGRISFRSRKGKGSVFTFTLPIKTVEQPVFASATASASVPEVLTAAARILLAEDEPMIREMITMMLAKKGYQVDFAETGRAALEKWENGHNDLILMDLQMPELNGLEATRIIREREGQSNNRTCIIGLTAHTLRGVREECLEAGMNEVLNKPVRMRDLYEAIAACLSDPSSIASN